MALKFEDLEVNLRDVRISRGLMTGHSWAEVKLGIRDDARDVTLRVEAKVFVKTDTSRQIVEARREAATEALVALKAAVEILEGHDIEALAEMERAREVGDFDAGQAQLAELQSFSFNPTES